MPLHIAPQQAHSAYGMANEPRSSIRGFNGSLLTQLQCAQGKDDSSPGLPSS